MKLRSILREATTAWVGTLNNTLGNGKPYTLNYGTGASDRPNILYVPIPLAVVRSALRHLNKTGFVGEGNKLVHVGEAHVTVSMGQELPTALGKDPVATLRAAGLFNSAGDGVSVKVRHTGDYKMLNAAFYRDEADPLGPMLVAELVEVSGLTSIRSRLGLTPLPVLPGIPNYLPHLTVGYCARLNKIHSSYVSSFGSTARQRV